MKKTIDFQGTKKCRVCGKRKPRDKEHFEPNGCKGGIRGDCFRSECRVCRRAASKKWREENKAYNRKRIDKWQEENPAKVRYSGIKTNINRKAAKKQKIEEKQKDFDPKLNTVRVQEWRERNPEKYRYNNVKAKVKRKDKSNLQLSFDHWKEHFLQQPCYLCGEDSNGGIDRVDNNKGYTEENTKPCCWSCNSIKNTRELKELKAHLLKMLQSLETMGL